MGGGGDGGSDYFQKAEVILKQSRVLSWTPGLLLVHRSHSSAFEKTALCSVHKR